MSKNQVPLKRQIAIINPNPAPVSQGATILATQQEENSSPGQEVGQEEIVVHMEDQSPGELEEGDDIPQITNVVIINQPFLVDLPDENQDENPEDSTGYREEIIPSYSPPEIQPWSSPLHPPQPPERRESGDRD